jgi:polysaccharide export outer membrane protein
MAYRTLSAAGTLALVLLTACAGPRAEPVSTLAPQPLLTPGAEPAARAAGRRIVPRDLLEVTVFDADELSGEMRVSDTGEISVPLLGVIPAAGSTPRELESALVDELQGKYMRDPHVTVQVKEEAAQPIYVLGEVNQAGAYGTGEQAAVTLLGAVSMARGLKSGAAAGRTVVVRSAADGSRLQIPVDLGAVMKGQEPDVILEVGDVVYVPKNTGRAVTLGVIDALVRVLTFRPALP